MASLIGSQTITIDGVDVTMNPSWQAKYATEIKRGNACTKAADILVDTVDVHSIEKVVHDEVKGVEKHSISYEENYLNAESPGGQDMIRIQVLVTKPKSRPDLTARTKAITNGVCAYIPTIVDSMMANEKD